MGSANSHEIRQIVDEAVVALRSGQHQQQRQSSRHHRRSEVISLDEDDDGVLFGEEGDYATYSTDDDGVWEPGYDSGSEEPVCGEECCSDSGWSECCYETVECCVGGGGRGRDRGWRHERCGVEAKKEKACKECEKKRMCRKCRKKAPSFWSRCYPVSGRRDWGGGVVGVSRCPGEQDPKKWGFKIDNRRGRPISQGMTIRCLCGGPGSCRDLRPSPAGTGRRHAGGRRTASGRCEEVLGDANGSQPPRRGRRQTLLFEEFDASPRGASSRMSPGDGYRYHEGDGPAGSRCWRRRRRDGSVDSGGLFAMHGALRDDEHQSEFRGGGGGGVEDGWDRGRTRSWERRSDLGERTGEVDNRSEGSSYAIRERGGMLVSRRENGGGRVVRSERG
ncbi:hypothetical protein CGRA01v4_09161 [Colletotrichum graminicola]|nr:hypothetical protein CGRA01v4_09161 [Colletotrichum graminicola]